MKKNILLVAALVPLLLVAGCGDEEDVRTGPEPICLDAGFPTTHDADIEIAVRKHWPAVWQGPRYVCLYRAQLAAESSLDIRTCERANSAGARCLAQLIPSTATEAADAGIHLSRVHAEASIMAGAWYMARLAKAWREPRPEIERHTIAAASYHTGLGHQVKAQRLARADGHTARIWHEWAPYLDRVISKANAEANRHYVQRIEQLTDEMLK